MTWNDIRSNCTVIFLLWVIHLEFGLMCYYWLDQALYIILPLIHLPFTLFLCWRQVNFMRRKEQKRGW
jgi:hypothetical protein